jgi:hypothetical protein
MIIGAATEVPRNSGHPPHSRFIEIPDSRTLIPLDQPRALADAIATFVSNPLSR